MITAWNERIPVPDTAVEEQCRDYVDNLTKPLGSLAEMEVMAVRLAGICGTVKPKNLKKAIVIAAADAAVDSEANVGHGASSYEETLLVAGGVAAVSAVARDIGAAVYLADVGLERDVSGIDGVMVHKWQSGSRSPKTREALTQETCAEAVAFGVQVAMQLAEDGVRMVGLGDIGERADLAALAVTAAFLGPELVAKIEAAGGAADGTDWELAQREPETVLARYGSASIAMLVGVILGAAASRMAVVIDNAVTGAAALAAVSIAPRVKAYLFSSAAYTHPLQQLQLHQLGMQGYLHYDFTLAQGLGSALGLSLLDGALDMLNEMKTFGTAGVTVAEDGPGKGRQREEVR